MYIHGCVQFDLAACIRPDAKNCPHPYPPQSSHPAQVMHLAPTLPNPGAAALRLVRSPQPWLE